MPEMLYRKTAVAGGASQVPVGPAVFGGAAIPVIAGPCSVESYGQLQEVAQALCRMGVPCMRGGAYKPRTSPYAFQGLGLPGLEMLGQIRQETGLAIISEVMAIEHIELAAPFVDCFQVGARNMQNFELLKALGKADKPVLLKRGMAATIDEFLYAAEYILAGGNMHVILCERGIRSFDSATRNVLDLGAVALLKELTHLPVIVDPSHGTGRRSLIAPLSLAALAGGADGLIIEMHPSPENSVSDPHQAIAPQEIDDLLPKLSAVAEAVGRHLLLDASRP